MPFAWAQVCDVADDHDTTFPLVLSGAMARLVGAPRVAEATVFPLTSFDAMNHAPVAEVGANNPVTTTDARAAAAMLDRIRARRREGIGFDIVFPKFVGRGMDAEGRLIGVAPPLS
ncbi:hypothetical protein MTE01_16570 [Microbacterium testaceum]|uniref:Uncharacterized protein n=1 Tax=Microbacterium testaceum TaxID=2033 RepID=A0A4Y3QKP0_MICTE|nr:hypothetical protein MTE01_16570 [Microbacterium testaceum]